MKRILLILSLVLIGKFSSGQLFGENKEQVEANDKQAFVFDYLVSDTLIYKSLMLRDTSMTVVMMHDIFANAMYVIVQRDEVDTINKRIREFAANQNETFGLGFNLTYLEDFSYQSKRKMKKIKDPYQKNMTKTFNKKVKYILMQQSARAVKGKRITNSASVNYGKIIPDFAVDSPVKVEPEKVKVEIIPEKKAEALPVFPPVKETAVSPKSAEVEKKKEIPPPGEWKREKRN